MQHFWARALALVLALLTLCPAALAADDRDQLFDQALAALMTPAEAGEASGAYALHTGDSAFAPCVAPPITPYDEQQGEPQPTAQGSFSSSDPAVVTVDERGLMTGIAPGEATVVCQLADGEHAYTVTVSDDTPPELIKNYIYVLNREFYSVKRARLPKYNQYAKWYYGRKKEVGWCAVFTIYCANAAGTNPVTLKELDAANPAPVQFLRQGQVGHQYDGFWDMGRFTDVPKPGYLVIYADMSNAYRTVHIGSVTAVEDKGDGVYAVTTVEGNMSNSVKSYCYLYDSKKSNHLADGSKGRKLQNNMTELPAAEQTDPLVQYTLHTDHWSVFGFCQTWQ